MTIDSLRSIAKRQPFEAFTIHMNDGRRLRITHPNYVFLPSNWKSTEIIVASPDGTFDFVYVRNITTVKSRETPPSLPSRKRRWDNGDDD